MAAFRPMLRVGLTGGIASGKTTVSRLLAGLGAFVLDADAFARSVMEPGASAYGRVVDRFGTTILDEEGRIVRRRLARLVFGDDEARRALNAIVHPEVMAEADRRLAAYAPRGRAPIAVFDAALLVESGLHRDFHRLIVTRCRRETQIRRLLARDGLSTEEAEARIDAQAPLEEKLKVAHYVVDTEGTLRETRKQTEGVYAALLRDFESEFGGADPGDIPI
jgi:dephospho-CoA kinase